MPSNTTTASFSCTNDPEPAEPEPSPALEHLASIDPDTLTPRQALDALYALKSLLK
jgi:DNA mismatch repair protein MutS